MTDPNPNLTPYPGQPGVFFALAENVPDDWQWRVSVTGRWRPDRPEVALHGSAVMCRVRPKRWLAEYDEGDVMWKVYDGDKTALAVTIENGEGLARRVAAFLNHEDEYSQLVMSLARATRDNKTNLTPYVQEAVRLTAAIEGRTGSAIG